MLTLLAVLAGCEPCPPTDPLADLPARLSETGLLGPDGEPAGLAYTPRFALWSDGAAKERWLVLPDGARIDTSNADAWQFPVGTTAVKAFTRDGLRVETRVMTRTGPGDADWAAVAYLWDGDDAWALPEGAADASGTLHDVPTAGECVGCHGGRSSFLLGVSAVQVDDATRAALADRVTDPIPAVGAPAADAPALGYLHANCSHCHNAEPAGAPKCLDPGPGKDFTLPAAVLTDPYDAPALRTARGQLNPGNPGNSEVVRRMSSRGALPRGMPALGTEEVDDDGVALIREWIAGL